MVDIEELVPERVGGFCGILAPFIAYGLISISILVNPDFSFASSALSELGATDVAYNNIFNFGLIFSGLLFIIFLVGMFRLTESQVGLVGLSGIIVGAICLILVGVFPMGTDPHWLLALLFYSFSIGGMIIFGLDQFLEFEHVWGVLVWSNLAFALIAISLVAVLEPGGVAIYEVIGSIPIMQFGIVFGTRLFAE
ncbi:MAG: DUF998 domain-containing protein [Candidatus Thermoplasmatota archaeon]|nr:DUF998 domain-containing protein [Candidatus Thermoplasmatota archaeon]